MLVFILIVGIYLYENGPCLYSSSLEDRYILLASAILLILEFTIQGVIWQAVLR